MKRTFFLATLFCASFAAFAFGQSNPPLRLQEIDGSPNVLGVTTIKVTNGTLSCSGKTCTITISGGGGGSGTVTSVSFTGGLITVTNPTTAAALTVAGTSGGIPYFSSTSTWASSAALAANAIVIGGGAGLAPATTTTGTGVLTALGVNVGSAGAFVTFNGALGTPSSGTATNITGLPISTGVSGLGTGVATALAVNTGSAGAVVLFNGAGGTPSSLTLTNATGLPPTTGISGWPANASGVLTNNGSGTLSWAAAGGANPFDDATAIIKGSADATKLLRIEVDGFTTGTTRVWTAPNSDLTVAGVDIAQTFTGLNTFTSGVTTGTGATSGTVFNYNSLTTGVGANFSSSSITSGSIVNIASTSTAGATGVEGLNIAMSGVNGTAAQTVTGATISVTNTNATSGTNAALTLTASGATGGIGAGENRALNITAGQSVFPDGDNQRPSIAFSTNKATGIFLAGSTIIAFTVNASNTGVISGFNWITQNNGQFGVNTGNGTTASVGWARQAAAVWRASDGSTGAGSLVLGTSTVGSVGTGGIGVLAIANGTAPTTFPADEFQIWSADAAAGNANAYAANELGEITRLTGLAARNSAAFAVTSSTTLANITGLTRPVEAARAYAFHAQIQTTAAATGGVKFAVSGTATATSISYEGILRSGAALIAQTRSTALDGVVCASTTATAGTCVIEGVILVNAAGTLTIQFAQNNSDAGASTVLINQFIQLIPIS